MKKLFFLLLSLLSLSLLLPVAASTLSPAVQCLAGEVTLLKNGTSGDALLFTAADFLHCEFRLRGGQQNIYGSGIP